jgi:hypothetical protein
VRDRGSRSRRLCSTAIAGSTDGLAGGRAGWSTSSSPREGATSPAQQVLDAAGRRRPPATMPDFRAGRAPGNKGQRYAADPPTVDEIIIAVMRHARHARYGNRPQTSTAEPVALLVGPESSRGAGTVALGVTQAPRCRSRCGCSPAKKQARVSRIQANGRGRLNDDQHVTLCGRRLPHRPGEPSPAVAELRQRSVRLWEGSLLRRRTTSQVPAPESSAGQSS